MVHALYPDIILYVLYIFSFKNTYLSFLPPNVNQLLYHLDPWITIHIMPTIHIIIPTLIPIQSI